MRRAPAGSIAAAMLLALPAALPAKMRRIGMPQPVPPAAAIPPQLRGLQYLYGSGEAAALTEQTWRGLTAFVETQLTNGRHSGVVLAPDASLADPRFVDCGDKPVAAVFDVDETVLLNLGGEYDDLASRRSSFDEAAWNRWEQRGAAYGAASPGAKAALDRLRADKVAVIFNTNRAAANAAGTEAALAAIGLGPARHGVNLFMAGDDAAGPAKDGRRRAIAAHYCVLAMAGDQLGDFSDLFNRPPIRVAARRAAVSTPAIAALWGNGWFVMPNPVYGTALRGNADDIFPKDKQWRDPGLRHSAADAAAPASLAKVDR